MLEGEQKLTQTIRFSNALARPLTIYDVHKNVRTQRSLLFAKYASVNKRVRSLEESGYIKKAGVRKTKAGFAASIYELTNKAYLEILFSSISVERLLSRLDESGGNQMLVAIIRVLEH